MAGSVQTDPSHADYMRIALALSQRALGTCWPNPAVGCVLVKKGIIIGRGWTQPTGRPHAEVVALNQAGSLAKGATAYVTLEPCSHFGKTPPCADALIDAGVEAVHTALIDPDPRVSGKGIQKLEKAGVQVSTGLLASAAHKLQRGYLFRLAKNRPLVSAKIATTLDGKIATHCGDSQWITGEKARLYGHLMRLKHDAILIGSRTALADDPLLTCRLAKNTPAQAHPLRVVLDRQLKLPLSSQLVKTAKQFPLTLICGPDLAREDEKSNKFAHKKQRLEAAGVTVITVPLHQDQLDLKIILNKLAEIGITRLMVEGGGKVLTSFISAGLVDDLYWIQARQMFGKDGASAIGLLGVDHLKNAHRWSLGAARHLSPDYLQVLHPVQS